MPRSNSLAARDIENLVHPQTNLVRHRDVGPTFVTRGNGVWVTDDDGKTQLDAVSGLWCASLGLASERLADVAAAQIRELAYAHLYRHNSHEPAVELAEKLLSIAPPHMSKVHFQCTGSEANDVAIKLVWYYHHATGRPEKRKIISRKGAYHGSSVATVSLSGKSDMHAGFGLPLDGFLHTETPNYFASALPGESEENYATRLVDALEKLIEEEAPETIAAFFAEPVLGSSGSIPPPKTYFEKVQALLAKHDILFVADEVICGFGRTGSMWGSETFGIVPDIMSSAKALSAGMAPISALLISEKVHDAMVQQSETLGSFAHGHTYAGHPVSAAVALETLKIYEEMDLLTHIGRRSQCLHNALMPLADHPMVGVLDIVGFMAGMELVRDKRERHLFDAGDGIGARVADASRRHGLIHRGMGNRIAFAPAYVMGEDEINEVASRLKLALDDVWSEVSREKPTTAAALQAGL